MRLILKQGDESRELDVTTMPIADAIACEQYADMTWVEWFDAFVGQRAVAIQFAWWLAGRRAGVTEKFSEVTLDLARMGVEVQADPDDETPEAGPEDESERPTGGAEVETPAH